MFDRPIIGGRHYSTKEIQEIYSPYSGKKIKEVSLAGSQEIEKALETALSSFHGWKKTPGYRRREILLEAARKLKEKEEEFSKIIAQEIAKPIKDSRGEVGRAITTLSLSAEESIRVHGEFLPLDTTEAGEGKVGIVRRFPRGVVLGITPFNFPLNLVMHKVGPALAAGATVIIKPPPQSPTPALMLAEILYESGLPEGVLSVLPTSNELAERMVLDQRVSVLSFTGSAKVGWYLKEKAPRKHVVLELGGNAAVIVHSDADLDYAAQRILLGGFSYAGQVCISVQRVYVEQTIFDDFTERLLEKVDRLRIGDPMDEETDLSVLIDEGAAIRVSQWIEEAKDLGAQVLRGGEREGRLLYPTVLEGITPRMKVFSQEVFGPVIGFIKYRNFTEALEGVNDSDYGLHAGIFTTDPRLIKNAFSELEVGGIIINDVPTFRVDSMPYGGTKASGVGREGVRYAIQEFTEPRLLVLNLT